MRSALLIMDMQVMVQRKPSPLVRNAYHHLFAISELLVEGAEFVIE
jgi:hypothetical protein